MVTYLELSLICFVAILFVLLFKIQKNVYPQNYFSNSQFILSKDVSYKMLVIRYIFILLFSLIVYFVLNSRTIVVIGTLLGSFLIIWPTLIAPSEAYLDIGYIKSKDKVVIYLLHFIFVISSTLVAYFATIFVPLLKKLFCEYKMDALYDLIKYFFFSIIFNPLEKKGKAYLNRNIINNTQLVDIDE